LIITIKSYNYSLSFSAYLSGVSSTYFKDTSKFVWLGYNDATTEGTFAWKDNSTVDYIHWDTISNPGKYEKHVHKYFVC
jgi:hypothetical protein